MSVSVPMESYEKCSTYLGMGDIDILAYDYCEASISRLLNNCICIENVYKCVKLSLNVSKYSKTYHSKCQLSRYYMIIASHDYC